MEGEIALKIVGALLATLDQQDPNLIDRLRKVMAAGSGSPTGEVALSAVDGIIAARSQRT